MKSHGVTIQMKLEAVLSHGTVLPFGSVDETLWCYHSNETSIAVLSHGTIYLVCSYNFGVCGWNPMVSPFKWNLLSSAFTWHNLVFSILWTKSSKFCWVLIFLNNKAVAYFSVLLATSFFSKLYFCRVLSKSFAVLSTVYFRVSSWKGK